MPTPTPVPPPAPVPTATYQELLADSLFKLASQVYYWNTYLSDSSTFKPLGYAKPDTLAGLTDELFSITQNTINPATGKGFEFYQYNNGSGGAVTTSKYSYIRKTSDIYNGGATSFITNQSDVKDLKMTLDGKSNDLGFTVGIIPVWYVATNAKDTLAYTVANRDSSVIFARTVTNGSPAYNAGLRRGDIIANSELNYNVNKNAIVNAMNSNSVKLVLYRLKTQKKDTLSDINKAVYTFNPVLRDTMVTIGVKKIAYIAYQSFTTNSNSNSALDEAFGKFADATDVVVDLRENGGGYVNTAEYLINLLAPQSANNKTAFIEYYNQTMRSGQATTLKGQKVFLNNVPQTYTYFDLNYTPEKNTSLINKKSGINTSNTIKSIYFIVSSRTASAAELVINSLIPYYDNVVLIGSRFSDNGKLTYGKPIGFFELRLGKYSVYMSSFETKNAAGNGGYYGGISTTYQEFDDVRYNYGDPNESCFLKAIRLITNNSAYSPTASRTVLQKPIQIIGIPVGNATGIHDMIASPAKR